MSNSTSASSSTPALVDEALYSRQLYVMGHEAQRRMAESNVLLVGLNGLGVETAKNIILAGVKSVTLFDDTLTTYADLSSQFYLSEANIGQPRAQSCVAKLAELNPYVSVSLLQSKLDSKAVDAFSVVVLIDVSLEVQQEIAAHCHTQGIAVIIADCHSVFGSIFWYVYLEHE